MIYDLYDSTVNIFLFESWTSEYIHRVSDMDFIYLVLIYFILLGCAMVSIYLSFFLII
jgi:hypothetical protein